MRLLLDTHVYLWIAEESGRLSNRARNLIHEAEEVFISSASIWEVSIKASMGKMIVDVDSLAKGIARRGYVELPVHVRHALALRGLPAFHRDPFDRLLIAQATSENLNLLTADKRLPQYSPLVIRHA